MFQFVLFKKNFYIWYFKFRSIKLFVFDVILKNVIFGKVFYVEGFSKFVEMFIKNWYWERDEIKLKEMFFVKLSFLKLIKNM